MAHDDRRDPWESRQDVLPAVADLTCVFAEVHTARLVLRRPHVGDGPAMFRVHGDPATNRYNPARTDPDLAASEATLLDWLRGWEADGYGYWAVTLPPTREVIGFGGVRRFAWRERDVLNLYYRFVPVAWGHGYAAEMARAAVELSRAHLPGVAVVARTRAPNEASQRTAARAGLIRCPDLDSAEYSVFALGWPTS